jgi:phytanoyl-CoA hydroxylase
MLSQDKVDFYNEHGYLRIPNVFSAEETEELAKELDRLIDVWASDELGWTGGWRQALMTPDVDAASKLVALHDLQLYSSAWCRAVCNPKLAASLADLLGSAVEFHHSTMHVKPPETGQPFPMHQDWPFYPHSDQHYVDVLVHLDDTSHDNGEIRFLEGSHKLGVLEHITETPEGPCTPYLPLEDYRLEDTTPVPARAGDVVCFNICTIHGSYLNATNRPRRLVRVGYRDPDNRQSGGQSMGRPGWVVDGFRPRAKGQEPFAQS